jgi:hypothetical protein
MKFNDLIKLINYKKYTLETYSDVETKKTYVGFSYNSKKRGNIVWNWMCNKYPLVRPNEYYFDNSYNMNTGKTVTSCTRDVEVQNMLGYSINYSYNK